MFPSYAQVGQDIAVGDYFEWKTGGYFIDVGAWDGIDISNTYMFEKHLGWNGICIEPLPSAFSALEKNRASVCVKVAAYSVNDLEIEFVESGNISGIVQNYIASNVPAHLMYALHGNKIKVKTKTLADIMNEHKTPNFIEYLSIDTEGSELEILRGIDWIRYSFGYISVEHNSVEPRRSQMRQFLEERGYKYLRENMYDDDYVHADGSK